MLKTAKNQMEIPLTDKSYIFVELDRKEQADPGNLDPLGETNPLHLSFTNDIDKWIEAIE